MRNLSNLEIRMEMLKNGLTFREMANYMNMYEQSFSRKLRHTMSEKEKIRVLKAIEELRQIKGGKAKE